MIKVNIVWLLLLTISANGQISNDKILETFLNDTAFGKFVVPGFYNNCDTIHIIDTSNQFTNAQSIKFSKIVSLNREFIKMPPFKKWYCNNLIVDLKRDKKYFKLTYFHEPSNSAGFVRYKLINRQRLKKVKYQYGQY